MRRSPLRPPTLLLVAGLISVLAAALVDTPAFAAGAAKPVRVTPMTMPRAGDAGVAHIEGSTYVDGSQRVEVPAAHLELLGAAGSDHLLAAIDDQGTTRVLRVLRSGAVSTVLTPARNGDLVVLSADGSRLAQATTKRRARATKLTVWDTATGSVTATKNYPGVVRVLDLDAAKVLVGGQASTTRWQMSSGLVRTVARRAGYAADLSADRLATFTRDPYDGGCTVVSKISAPEKKLWRSCSERVEEFGPRGRRMATVALLSDGIGPAQVQVRSSVGVAKGVYRIRGYFARLTWQSPTTLLMEAFGRDQGATISCTGRSCARVSDLTRTPDLRRQS